MSTNASISMRRLDGTETSIYLHWDGNVDNAGVILQRYYSEPDKVEALLALGDLSVLDARTEPSGKVEHNAEHREPGVCLAYHRDLGEEYKQNGGDQGYNYIFDESLGVWYVQIGNGDVELLLPHIMEEEEDKNVIAECTKAALSAVNEAHRAEFDMACIEAGYVILDTFPTTDEWYCTMFVVKSGYLEDYLESLDSYNNNGGVDLDEFYLNYIWDETYFLFEKALDSGNLVCWWNRESEILGGSRK